MAMTRVMVGVPREINYNSSFTRSGRRKSLCHTAESAYFRGRMTLCAPERPDRRSEPSQLYGNCHILASKEEGFPLGSHQGKVRARSKTRNFSMSVSDTLRQAIRKSGQTLYRIAQDTGIDWRS